MTITRRDLSQYLNEYLAVSQFKDYAPNGLQVEGKNEIKKIVTGVTACQALIDAAIAANADAILVHHGFFWKNEPEVITGMKYRRIKALMDNDISLFGYHLPLDAHGEVGNNAQLAKELSIDSAEVCDEVAQNLLWRANLSEPVTAQVFAQLLHQRLNHAPLHIGEPQDMIHSVAWCTGGAQDYIDVAAQLGVDAFISGEVSERTFHAALEQGVHYFAAGHHATERFGIQALGAHLQQKFGIEHEFIDIINPV